MHCFESRFIHGALREERRCCLLDDGMVYIGLGESAQIIDIVGEGKEENNSMHSLLESF